MRLPLFSFLLFLLLVSCTPNEAPLSEAAVSAPTITEHPEYANVESAILDYVESLYQADSTRVERSVDSTLRKVGYYFNEEKNAYTGSLEMTFAQLSNLAAGWNKDGDRVTAESPKEIQIFEINDKTAIGKLTAEWGIDYFQLAHLDGKWKIMNVIWQSAPRE
jgi:hypothetical protein